MSPKRILDVYLSYLPKYTCVASVSIWVRSKDRGTGFLVLTAWEISSPPLPALLFAPFFARSLTLVLVSKGNQLIITRTSAQKRERTSHLDKLSSLSKLPIISIIVAANIFPRKGISHLIMNYRFYPGDGFKRSQRCYKTLIEYSVAKY